MLLRVTKGSRTVRYLLLQFRRGMIWTKGGSTSGEQGFDNQLGR